MQSRMEELLQFVHEDLQRSGFVDLLGAGVVLTGGTAQMEGVLELAEQVFQMPVRLGVPLHVTGLEEVVRNPIYATGVGLLMCGVAGNNAIVPDGVGRRGARGAWHRMKGWFQGNF